MPPSPSPSDPVGAPLSALSISDPYESVARAVQPPQRPLDPSYAPHSPENTLKRSDPFQFGSRYLLETDDVFAYNAWDHVETDDAYKVYSEAQYAAQRANPASEYDRERFNRDPAKWWDLFYKQKRDTFFKDRRWLRQEFPVLEEVSRKGAGRKTVLEVGAGAGNTAFPLVRGNENDRLFVHAVDFSKKAVEVLRGSEGYDERSMRASVWDITSEEGLPEGVEEGGVDVVVLVFVMSALNPAEWERAVRNVWRCLRPGGVVLFRDYGRGDLAQVRFKKGRWMGENFYVRGDGTRVYFWDVEEVKRLWEGFTPEMSCGTGIEPDAAGKSEDMQEAPNLERDEKVRSIEKSSPSDERISNYGPGSRETQEPSGSHDEHLPSDLKGRSSQGSAFEILDLDVDRRLLVNRQRKLKMYRCWLQGRFRKRM